MIYGQFLVGVDGGTVARTSGEFTYDTLSQFLTKSTADKFFLNENGDEMSGDIKMNNFKIENLKDPTNAQDVATKSYVDKLVKEAKTELFSHSWSARSIKRDTLDKDRLPLEFNNFKVAGITGLQEPVNDSDAVSRAYVNNKKWAGESITMGKINKDRLPETLNTFSTPRITGLNVPVHPSDAVNKAYVDNKICVPENVPQAKVVFLKPRTYINEVTYIDENGSTLSDTIATIHYKKPGRIICIIAAEYEKDTNQWREEPKIREHVTVECGYLCYFGNRFVHKC